MQRYFAKEIVNNKIVLEDSDIHHIKNVMRGKINDKIEVIYDKKIYLCQIEEINPFLINVIEEKQENNELDIEFTVAIGLVKEQKFDLIIQKLTELGVSKIIPLQLERNIVKITKEKENKKKVRWQTICKEASEQSHRNIVPEVTDIKTIKDIVNEDSDLKLVCSTKENEKIINNYLQQDKKYAKMLIVIGPEGGISPKEEEYLNNNGFDSVSLGKRIMRVETAAFYVASVICYNNMR